MRKDNRIVFCGFTMAEILISIAIAMIVATAMVPLIGTGKIKKPTNRVNHGVAACYYDTSGRLHYEYRENKSGGISTDKVIGGNHCTFPVPKSNYLEIIAIGAGGNTSNAQPVIVSGVTNARQEGDIRVDNNFQVDIEKAASTEDADLPSKIRAVLNEWASSSSGSNLFANFTLTSPIGAGGSGLCQSRVSLPVCGASSPMRGGDGPYGSYYRANTSYDTGLNCWWYQHGKGGASGTGLKKSNVKFYLDGHSDISIEDNAERTSVRVKSDKYGDKWITMAAAKAGNSPTFNGTRYIDGAAPSSSYNATCSSNIG